VQWVDELHDAGTVSAPLYARAGERFSERQLMDITLTAGFYGVVSMILNTCRTELEEGKDDLPDHRLWTGNDGSTEK
jgi:hypothetical protein